MDRAYLDGGSAATPAALHAQLREQLPLPRWYGNNLDALFDCLTDLQEDTLLIVRAPHRLRETLGSYGDSFLRVLRDAAGAHCRFHYLLEGEPTAPLALLPLRRGSLRALADPQGGELISLTDGTGVEYIWGGHPASWPGRSPVLFPIVGSLAEDTVFFDGQPYSMPRHGFARKSLFSLSRLGEDGVAFTLTQDPSTLARYPFPFRLTVCHQLTDDGFSTRYTVENTGDAPLPFCIGGHPAFRCPLRPGEAFEDYRLQFDLPEEAGRIPLTPQGLLSCRHRETVLEGGRTIPLDHALFDRADTLIFQGLRSTGVSLLHGPSVHGLRLDFSQFPMVAFWTKPGAQAPFLCLEPWHGCADVEGPPGEFCRKLHAILLPPGQRKTLSYSVSLF